MQTCCVGPGSAVGMGVGRGWDPRGTGSVAWQVASGGGSCRLAPSLPLGSISDLWKWFSKGSAQPLLTPGRAPGLGPGPGFTQFGVVSLEPNCLDLLSVGTRSRKCWPPPGSACTKCSRLPAACSAISRPRWLQATGWMTQVSCAGQTSRCAQPSGVMTVISCPVITVPPHSEGGLARPAARA